MPPNFEIARYISPNISPEVLIASGPEAEVDQFAEQVGGVEAATIVARASDGTTGFLKAHLNSIRYSDFIGLMQARPPHVDVPFVRRVVPSEQNGRAEDVGNPHAAPVIVGVLADHQALVEIKAHLSWARLQLLNVKRVGQGLWFEPEEKHYDAYKAFVDAAAAGHYANATVVLLKAVQSGREPI